MKLDSIISLQPAMRYIDGAFWKLLEPIRFTYHDSAGVKHLGMVPVGFKTDLASIPAIIPIPEGPYNLAGVIHDWMYQKNGVSRLEADQVLHDGCRLLDVSRVRSWVIYAGVRVGGWVVWNRYRRKDRTANINF